MKYASKHKQPTHKKASPAPKKSEAPASPLVPKSKKRLRPLDAVPIFVDAYKVFDHTHGTIRAAALTYTTLLAVVPLVILLTSISVALGMADLLTHHLPALNKLFNLNLPLDQILPILENAQQIKLGRLGLIGSGGLFVTFILAMDTIESNMNVVWRVHKNRSYLRKAAIYTPFLLICAGIIGALSALIHFFRKGLEVLLIHNIPIISDRYSGYLLNGTVTLSLNVLLLGALWILYYFMPYTKVRRKPALIASLFTWAALYVYVGSLIFLQASMFERMSLFYGSLAFLPLVMVLLFGIWAIVLFGNALCWRIQHWRDKRPFENQHLLGLRFLQ